MRQGRVPMPSVGKITMVMLAPCHSLFLTDLGVTVLLSMWMEPTLSFTDI